jgi:hypothetical protein
MNTGTQIYGETNRILSSLLASRVRVRYDKKLNTSIILLENLFGFTTVSSIAICFIPVRQDSRMLLRERAIYFNLLKLYK